MSLSSVNTRRNLLCCCFHATTVGACLQMLSRFFFFFSPIPFSHSKCVKRHSQCVLLSLSFPLHPLFSFIPVLCNSVIIFFLLFCSPISPPAPSPVSSIKVNTPAELHASKGEAVTLSCTFTSTSRPTSKMTVDWSYRPQSGGPPQTVSIHLSI